jgi:hypothetical protein
MEESVKRLLTLAFLTILLVGSAVATESSGMVCTKTGETVESCCCVEKDGALVCTLTGEAVSACCCTPSK